MTVELSDLLARWHPRGLARLSGAAAQRLVTVRGGAGAGASALGAELAEVDGIACTDAAADVVVHVVDAAAPITDDEVADIEAIVAGGQSVVVAVNKIDVHPAWELSLAATADRVASVKPGIPVVGVSALLAQLGRQTGTEMPHSGFGPVVHEIANAATLAGDRVLDIVITEAIANVERELVRAQETETGLRARRIDLLGQRDGGRTSALTAAKAKIQLARVGLLHDVNDAIRGAGRRLRAQIDRASAKQLRDGTPMADCANELLSEVHMRAHERLAPFGVADLDLSSVRMPEPPHGRSRGAEDGLMVVLGASAGFGIGRLAIAPLSLVPAADIASMPVALGLGGAVAWWFVRMRSLGADRVHVRAWANDALASMKSQLEQIVHGRLVELETTLAGEAMAASTRHAVVVDQELAQVEAELRRQLPILAERRAQLTSDLAALRRAGSGSCTSSDD